MDSKLALKVLCVLAACWALAVAADDGDDGDGQVTQVVQTDDGNGDITNDTIEECDPEQPENKCECEAAADAGETPDGAEPKLQCVKFNVSMGRTRYSALTQSVMLQLNEMTPNSALYSPSGFKVVAGFAVNSVSRVKNASGAPRYVTMTSSAGVPVTFEFADGESVGTPLMTTDNLADGRLAMVDAQGWATASDPAYYDYLPGDGARWRFGAAVLSPDYMQFVEHRTPEGRVETRQDLGLEIVRDAEGCLRQVATPAWVADFLVTGQDAYDLTIYPNDASCVTGTRTAEGLFEFVQGAEPAVVWEFRNPEPGLMRDLQVTKKRGTVSEAWLYRYAEDVMDFTLVYPQNAKLVRLERFSSDNRKAMVLRRSVLGADGKSVSVREKHFDTSGKVGRVVKSVRDPGGLALTKGYGYLQDGPQAGLREWAVYEDGSWARYEYDDQRRKTADIRPWLDAPTNAPINQCAVTRFSYEFVDAADFLRGGDKRPRTVAEEICGIEVARTYHAYPTNALGQVQKIEERAAFQGAPYGHASNRRTVKTYYASSAAAHLAGRLASITYPGSKVEEYGYEYGTFNAVAHVFTSDPDGGAWRETVTTSYGANSGVQALRSARVWDEKGREVLNESYVEDGAAFALIGWKRLSYNLNGKLVETAYSDGRVESATWGANCCGQESKIAADGTTTVYGYNLLKQKISETKKGLAADGSGDITTLYTYDLENRVLSIVVTNIDSGLGYVASLNAYDAVGRLTNAIDRLGNATRTSYVPFTTTVYAPNGVTSLIERYLDGQTKNVLENGIVKQSYAYGVNSDGTCWTLSAQGPLPAALQATLGLPNFSTLELFDFPWQLQAADPLGSSVATYKPGFGGTVLVTSNAYDIVGNILSSTQASCLSDGSRFTVYSSQLHSYSSDGSLFLSAHDVNTNGSIDLDGPDRVIGSSSVYEKDVSNTWWNVSRSWVYPEFNSSAAVTTSVQRVQLTGLGVQQGDDGLLTSYSEALDVRGNAKVSEILIDRAAKAVTQLTLSPTSVQPSTQITINGLRVSSVSTTSVTNTYAYDAFGRQTTLTDGRGNTSVLAYNSLGQVAYTEDSATNRTSYTYDALGRRTEVTDALGNVTQTQYDDEGHLTKTWGATYPVEYGYDSWGRKNSQKTFRNENGLGDETRWLYDNPTGLLTNKLYADGKGPSYTYTADGKLASRLWARGILSYYAYDAVGLLLGVDYSDSTPDIAYTYDRLGNQISAVSSVSTNLFVYSLETLELISETQNGLVITRSIDVLGRSAGVGVGDGYVVAYGYDDFGRFCSVSSSVSSVSSTATYSHLPGSDLLTGYMISSPVSNFQFQVSKAYEPHRDLITSVSNHVNSVLISAYDYANDAHGRRVSRQDSGFAFTQSQANTFGYNPRSEVTSAVMHTNAYGYVYDPIGDRLLSSENAETNSYASNVLDQYTNITSQFDSLQPNRLYPSYDYDGNMTYDGKEWHYIWNGENRLILASNATHVVTYAYDHQGRMVSKVTGSAFRSYLWDGYNIISEKLMNSGTNELTNCYSWGLDLSSVLQGAGGVGGLLAVSAINYQQSATNSYYPAYDANGNITEYLNSDGSIDAHYEYSAFGKIIVQSGELAFTFTHRFSTKPWCAVTGLSEYEMRKYEPSIGRWLSRDPIRENGFIRLFDLQKSGQQTNEETAEHQTGDEQDGKQYIYMYSVVTSEFEVGQWGDKYIFLNNNAISGSDYLGLCLFECAHDCIFDKSSGRIGDVCKVACAACLNQGQMCLVCAACAGHDIGLVYGCYAFCAGRCTGDPCYKYKPGQIWDWDL